MSRISIRAAAVALVGAFVTLTTLGRPLEAQRAGARPTEQVNGRAAAAGEVLLRFQQAPAVAELADLATTSDADAIVPVGRLGIRRVRSKSLNVAALLDRLRSRGNVQYVEPNYVVRAFTEPNDAAFPQLWGLKNVAQAVNGGPAGKAGADIHATEAWDVSLGSTAQVVAVVDSGIDYTHPDLAANMWSAPSPFSVSIGGQTVICPAGSHGFDVLALSCSPLDDNGHGTHVAGTIGATGQNAIGVVGVNWVAQMMAVRFVDASGQGTVEDAINALDFAMQAKAAFATTSAANVRVVSASWGGTDFSQALLDTVNATGAADMLFVAAAGNSAFSNDILPTYPASFDAPNVISVLATTNTDARAWFSNYGSSVDLGAPGLDILSTVPGNSYQFMSGTSMATPHVSGSAALVLSRCALSTAELKNTLLTTVESIPALASITATGGRLDVNSAIHSCMAPPNAPVNLAATAGDAVVKLTWSGGAGATSFNVKRAATAGGPYGLVASNVTKKSYNDQTVVNGTTYYYVVSGTNTLGQSNDSNEASATPKAATDLIVSAMTVPPTGGAGVALTVTETTTNQSGSTGPTTTRFYLSKSGVVDANARTLDGTHAVPSLAAGASSTATVSLTIPADVTTGLYYVVAKADADNVEAESKETNNTAPRIVSIGPDLMEAALTAPAAAAAGGVVAVTETTRNQGGGAAPATTTRFYLSNNVSLDANDPVLTGSRAIPALAGGESSTGTTAVTLPAPLTAGLYYLFAKADTDNAVIESQEINNTAVRAIYIGGDLVVSAVTAPARGATGGTIAITDTTANRGAGSIAASTTRFYLSADITLSASDFQLPGARSVPALDAGASSTGTTMVTLPSPLTPGLYYLLAKADADNVDAETQEANNTALRTLLVGPDLAFSGMSTPFKVFAGSTIAVSTVVINQGADPAAASVTRFYLSTDITLNAGDIQLSGAVNVPALGAGASNTSSTSVVIPAEATPGNYYLFAVTDADATVGESAETNNTAIRVIQIAPQP